MAVAAGSREARFRIPWETRGVPFLKASLVMKGLSGIVAQVVLMRELLISFHGNELTLGIILANWLLLAAVGSFIMGKAGEKAEGRIEVFALLLLFFALALPFTTFFSRIFRNILPSTPGEELGFSAIFSSSFIILLPVALLQGALFSYGCKLYPQCDRKDVSSIGKVYALETAGAILGGLLITFLLLPYLNSFQIALILSLTTAALVPFLLRPDPNSTKSAFRKPLGILSVLFCFVFAYSLLPQPSNAINQSSFRWQWRNLNVVHTENSIYGNITVTKRNEQYTFFTNGVPSITTPVPDIASVEDFVHFPMLFHEKPESVLILNGGVGGMIHEVLKYPVKRLDYVELDPLLLKLVQKFSTPLTQSELSDLRVKLHEMDGRYFIKKTRDRFDLIFIGLPAPLELQANRLFSKEFFSAAGARLNPDGILILTLPGSLTYISPELRDLNKCILDTLRTVFRSVRVIPGETNLYLASGSDKLQNATKEEIIDRLEERQIQTSLFTKSYLELRLHDRWIRWFSESMEGREIQINSDFRPVGVFLSLSYWNALFSPSLARIFKEFSGFSLRISAALLTVLTLLTAVLFIKQPRYARQSIPYAIFTTGLAGMIFNLAIIFTFQTFYGYLYRQIGLLIALFMLGVALSSFYMTRFLEKIERGIHLFLAIEIAIVLFSCLFPFVFSIPSQYFGEKALSLLVYPVFLIMSFFSGASIGVQFPLASKLYFVASRKGGTLGAIAGSLYGADLLGGFLGGLIGGVLWLPVLGLKESCFMLAIIKISSLALFLISVRVKKAK